MLRSFSKFLTEETVQTHIDHIEDQILTNGKQGALSSIQTLYSIITGDNAELTVKLDGAPQITCGTDPETGLFFVGTKSVFNKIEKKINFTNADIEKNHSESPGLVKKLKYALKYLQKLEISGVVSGDLMFTKGDLKRKKIGDTEFITFQPNTIVYAVPTDADFAGVIQKAKLGIVFHTAYNGESLLKLTPRYRNLGVNTFKKTSDVWFMDLSSHTPEKNMMTVAEKNALIKDLKEAKFIANSISHEKLSSSKIRDCLMRFLNFDVKRGVPDPQFENLIQFAQTGFKTTNPEKLVVDLEDMKDTVEDYFRFYSLMVGVKYSLLKRIKPNLPMTTFLKNDGKLERTNPEGYVYSGKNGRVVKLVDRFEFSRANFLNDEPWD